MKSMLPSAPILFALLLSSELAAIGQGSAFTYQGRLSEHGSPVVGFYDLQFALRDAASNGNPVGPLLSRASVPVSNGLFTAVLDFGSESFNGSARWLEISVRTNGSGIAHNLLEPPQLIASTPYAMLANSAAVFAGHIADSQLSENIARLNSNAVFTGAIRFDNPDSAFNGTFYGNGIALTNVNLAVAKSFGAISWQSEYGAFARASSLPVGKEPSSVAASDVNGDRMVDLISADQLDNTLTILTNNGAGGFEFSSSLDVGERPIAVLSADLNGDGKTDLVSANYGDGTLSVLTNGGNGFYKLAQSPQVGISPIVVVSGDFNRDGFPDLFSRSTVLTNNGRGYFVAATVVNEPFGAWAAVADVNGDGQIDLIGDGGVLTNNGRAGFKLAAFTGVGQSGIVADVNADGRGDLILANSDAFGVRVFTNSGLGQFTYASQVYMGSYFFAGALTATDIDEDGKLDLIVSDLFSSGQLRVLINQGHGHFMPGAVFDGGDYPLCPNVVDLNRDGKVDIVTANLFDDTLTVLTNMPIARASFSGSGRQLTEIDGYNIIDQTIGSYKLATNIGVWTVAGSNVFYSAGRVGIGLSNPVSALQVRGAVTATAFNTSSDRNLKENFEDISSREVLEKVAMLPIRRWSFKDDAGTSHLGPMAQDFRAAFGVGENDTTISTVDADGVALAAIQGLNRKLEESLMEKEARIRELERVVADLRTLVDRSLKASGSNSR